MDRRPRGGWHDRDHHGNDLRGRWRRTTGGWLRRHSAALDQTQVV